jgi:hypothetical protein
MEYFVPIRQISEAKTIPITIVSEERGQHTSAELLRLWGADICRLEYLIHLVDTGRIKSD